MNSLTKVGFILGIMSWLVIAYAMYWEVAVCVEPTVWPGEWDQDFSPYCVFKGLPNYIMAWVAACIASVFSLIGYYRQKNQKSLNIGLVSWVMAFPLTPFIFWSIAEKLLY